MQFTTFALSALSVAGALAQKGNKGSSSATATADAAQSTGGAPSGMVKMHVVRVGGLNGSQTFSPNEIKAAVGDMVQFQYARGNHSVVQSTFDAPCAPSTGGIFSGYMPVKADDTTTPTYTIMINDTKPLWLYCSQGKHCQNGMSMVVNVAAGNKSLDAYKAAAAKVSASSAPGSVEGGTTGSNGTSGSGSDSGSGTSTSGGSSSSPSTPPKTPANAANIVSASTSLGLVAMVAAFFL